MTSFALYRLPYQTTQTLMVQHEGLPKELKSFTELNGKNGFVMAPFAVSPNQPMLLIEPDEVVTVDSGQWTVDSFSLLQSPEQLATASANSQLSTLRSAEGRLQGKNWKCDTTTDPDFFWAKPEM